MPPMKKMNLQSLIKIEELKQLKDIRIEQLPEQTGKIGEGAFGEVFLFKVEDGCVCAGKIPKINLFNKSKEEENTIKEHLKKILREIKVLHQLEHERIVKIFGFFLDQDKIVIFMEAMEGSVKDKIDEKTDEKYLSEREAMHYFAQAAEGLVYLHSRKPKAIIHRDIKCENLLLTAKNNVKLADFGLAVDLAITSTAATALSTAPTSFAGTYLFAAPEVIRKMDKPEAYGRKSDIWSLACTLVQMISGKPPHSTLSLFEFAQRSSSISSASISRNPLTAIFKFAQRSSNDSSNQLEYSGDLLPAATNTIKQLLNSLFIIDSKLRPSAEQVLALAYDVIRKAAQEDFNLGEKYYYGRDVPQSDEEAVNWYRKAAEQGDANGQYNLGHMYDIGRGVPQSDEEAANWYRKAAEQEHAGGQSHLGLMYWIGQGVPQSDEEAVKWYRKAVAQGNAGGVRIIGSMYWSGQDVPQSGEEAVKWNRKAAEQGDASAQYKLGRMYQNGEDVPQFNKEAVRWFRKAAEQGNAGSQNSLAFMYYKGSGIPRSYEEAAKWYRKAAEQDNGDGLINLGFMYQYGLGVPKSEKEAIEWYKKAAKERATNGENHLRIGRVEASRFCDPDTEARKLYRNAAEQRDANGRYKPVIRRKKA